MKKVIIAILCIALIAAGCIAAFAIVKVQKRNEYNNITSGGWAKADSPEITDELRKLFSKLEISGATYTPVALLETQIVAGRNYRVLCSVEPVVPNPVAHYAIVTLYADLSGNAEITSVLSSEAQAPSDAEGMTGAWADAYAENGSVKLTEDAEAAFKKAAATLKGVGLTPKALLATQVVAGTNYSILCEADSAEQASGSGYYTIIHIYSDLSGNAEIMQTYYFN